MTKVMVLKSVKADMTSYGGFVWPREGHVEAPGWDPKAESGNGLHGWLNGVGDFSLKVKEHDAVWLALEVEADDCIDLIGKVKFPRCAVVYAGGFAEAFKLCRQSDDSQHSGHASAAGYYGHASAAGHSGHASAAGYSGHASAAGHSGHASAAGPYGHASAAGHSGHASAAGPCGHASAAGDCASAAVLGIKGKARAGTNGSIILTFIDDHGRRRHAVGYVGEDGIEAGVWYQCDAFGSLVPVKDMTND